MTQTIMKFIHLFHLSRLYDYYNVRRVHSQKIGHNIKSICVINCARCDVNPGQHLYRINGRKTWPKSFHDYLSVGFGSRFGGLVRVLVFRWNWIRFISIFVGAGYLSGFRCVYFISRYHSVISCMSCRKLTDQGTYYLSPTDRIR